ncbi:MAG TPA: DMT family transporter [Ohtaekwangia sp.]|nr:DMT family transporter [Ohtaekwangia sp.]
MSIPKSTSSHFVTGILFALAGAVCFSTKAIFVKLAYFNTSVDAVTLLALRMAFAIPFFVISAVVTSRKSSNVKFTFKQWIGVAVIGCLGYYVSSLLDFLGLQYVSAGIERLVLFIYPTLVLMISSLVFKVKIRGYQWLAIVITYAGLLTAFWGEATFDTTSPDFYKGSLLIFVCAITYAIYIVGSGRLIPHVGASKFNSYSMSFACVAVFIHFGIVNNTSLFNLDTSVYLYSFAMAILSTVIPSYLVTQGIKRIGSDNAAIVGSVGPVSTIIQAYIFLHEPILALQLAGTALILFGVLMIGRKPKEVSRDLQPVKP